MMMTSQAQMNRHWRSHHAQPSLEPGSVVTLDDSQVEVVDSTVEENQFPTLGNEQSIEHFSNNCTGIGRKCLVAKAVGNKSNRDLMDGDDVDMMLLLSFSVNVLTTRTETEILADVLKKPAIGCWIHPVDSRTHYRYGGRTHLQATLVGGTVHTGGHAAGHGQAGVAEVAGEFPGRGQPRRTGAAASDHGHLGRLQQARVTQHK